MTDQSRVRSEILRAMGYWFQPPNVELDYTKIKNDSHEKYQKKENQVRDLEIKFFLMSIMLNVFLLISIFSVILMRK